MTICHNDLGKKNVLWRGTEFRIIDLEGLSFSNPIKEVYKVALSWSWFEGCNLNVEHFISVIKAYCCAGGKFEGDWNDVYYQNNDRLKWLEFNMKAFLETDSITKRNELKNQILFTINNVVNYNRMKEKIVASCNLASNLS